MGLRSAMAALAEEWDGVHDLLDADHYDELCVLVGEFADEGDPEMSAEIAREIVSFLTERLPVEHAVVQALLTDPAERFHGPESRPDDLAAWVRLAEPLRARLGDPAARADEVTRAPSFSQAPVRCLLLEPGGSRGDGLVRSPFDGLHDTTAPGSRGAADRQQGDAP